MSDLRKKLTDFQNEMKGLLLEDTFEVRGKMWKMKLPNEEEQTWVVSMLNMTTAMATYMSTRLAAISIGIREIDGVDVYNYFLEDWEGLSLEERSSLESMNQYARKYFVAEHMHAFLAEFGTEFINELWEKYQELEKRREGAQEIGKKS